MHMIWVWGAALQEPSNILCKTYPRALIVFLMSLYPRRYTEVNPNNTLGGLACLLSLIRNQVIGSRPVFTLWFNPRFNQHSECVLFDSFAHHTKFMFIIMLIKLKIDKKCNDRLIHFIRDNETGYPCLWFHKELGEKVQFAAWHELRRVMMS